VRAVAAQLLCALLLTLIAGCDDRPAASAASGSTGPTGNSTITGRVFLRGAAPALAPIDVSAVADCARIHPDGIPDEAIVAGPDGALQNVIVYLKGVPTDSGGPSRPAVVLDQLGCRYRPHVVALQTGQILRVESHDPFLHNVHIKSTTNAASNFSEFAQPDQPATTDTSFSLPEIFPVQCDVHPWMRAWVGVFDHPYFAVTDASGAFRIDKVPPGNFTLVAWQERFGEISSPLQITDGKNAAIDLTYSR
jgi:plastocyanin